MSCRAGTTPVSMLTCDGNVTGMSVDCAQNVKHPSLHSVRICGVVARSITSGLSPSMLTITSRRILGGVCFVDGRPHPSNATAAIVSTQYRFILLIQAAPQALSRRHLYRNPAGGVGIVARPLCVPAEPIPSATMSSTQSLGDLQSRLAIPDVVRFEHGPGGLVRIAVNSPLAQAAVYLHGAHVAHYRPAGQRPVLFMSAKSLFDPAKPIRGGIPICFPWFGARGGDPAAPLHGFCRLRRWNVESVSPRPDGAVSLVLALHDTDDTRTIWPFAFALRYSITIGGSLDLALEVHNSSSQPITFEEALHTYLAVADAREVSVSGLAGAAFIDRADGMKRKQQDPQPIRIAAETDRLYLNTQSTCVIDDPKGGRRIVIEKSGSDSTVVWNPWIAKAKAMPDFGDEEWPNMLCVETANAAENAVTLSANRRHRMEAGIRIEPR
jgi:glucose-6-phosphate 1-epimerase